MECERGAVERHERRRLCDRQAPGKLRASLIAISHDMSNARLILVALICVSPAVLLFDGPIMDGLVAGVTAVGIAIVSRRMRPRETKFFLSIALPVAALVVVPVLWMLIQVLPVRALAHPIWTSAEAALGHPITGAISIDLGAGVMAVGQYLTIVAVAFWSAAVAVDRQRAEWILFSLMAGTALIGLTVAANELFGLNFLNASAALFKRTQAIDCVAMGVIIAAAATIRTLERYETRHASPDRSVSTLLRTFAACIAALVVCAMALMLNASVAAIVATGYGIAALTAVVTIRRLGLGPWGTGAIALPAILTVVFLAAGEPGLRTKSFTLAFATQVPASLISMSQRILDDAPLAGTGAGTFAAIAPIYRDAGDQVAHFTAPTAAAAVGIELGRPILLIIVATMIGAIVILFRASLRRGRDSFYPAAGASCLITLLFLCFMNAGALGTAPAMIAVATLGLAFAQSKSRPVQ